MRTTWDHRLENRIANLLEPLMRPAKSRIVRAMRIGVAFPLLAIGIVGVACLGVGLLCLGGEEMPKLLRLDDERPHH